MPKTVLRCGGRRRAGSGTAAAAAARRRARRCRSAGRRTPSVVEPRSRRRRRGSRRRPAATLGRSRVAAQARELRAAVAGDPAEDLRGGEVLRLAAHLPDAAVGFAPVRERRLDLLERIGQAGSSSWSAVLGVDVDRVEQRAPDVVLALVVGAVADPHRPASVVALEVVERTPVEVAFAADAVHDLQVAVARSATSSMK